jgi:hypothetical protein
MRQKRDFYFLLGASLILVILWVIFSIYHNLNASTISRPVEADINPIEATFKEDVITNLKNRQKITPLFTVESSPSPSPSISASPTPIPSPTQSQTSTDSAGS